MFRIGDFSKFSRVSVRMLRHYDQLGLLQPAHVDPATEYRYYTADQLPRLHRILALQDLGFTLEQIRSLLDRQVSADEMRGMLLMKHAELQNKVQEDQDRLGRIADRIDQMERSETAHYDVVVRKVKPLRVAAIRVSGREARDLTPLFEELESYVGRYKARQEQPPLALYFGDEAGEGEAAVAVPLKSPIEESERVRMMDLPSVDNMACVIHHGDYENIHLAGDALMRWVEKNPFQVTGPMREVYYRFGAGLKDYELPAGYLTSQDDEFVTEIQIPVERK
ncbi:MAG: MerR family transcriptional regulator [Anaerolineales bacterium]